MSCRRMELLLPAAVDPARLDPGAQREVDHHIRSCTSCASELAAMQTARDALTACGPAEPPQDLARRISRSVRAAAGEQSTVTLFWDRFIPIAWPTAIAATVAAALLLTLALRGPASNASPAVRVAPADPVEQIASATGNEGQLATNVLAMGTD